MYTLTKKFHSWTSLCILFLTILVNILSVIFFKQSTYFLVFAFFNMTVIVYRVFFVFNKQQRYFFQRNLIFYTILVPISMCIILYFLAWYNFDNFNKPIYFYDVQSFCKTNLHDVDKDLIMRKFFLEDSYHKKNFSWDKANDLPFGKNYDWSIDLNYIYESYTYNMVSFVIFAEHITNLMIELDYQLLNSADASFNPTSGNIN